MTIIADFRIGETASIELDGVWTWLTSDTVTTQAFGAASSVHTVVFT